MSDLNELKKQIEKMVTENKVFLFMKGTPQFPSCGFSAQVCAILKDMGASYAAFDVLTHEGIRQGIKEYANWPTIPQLYIDGKFIGGCDIVTELHQRGELAKMVGSQE